MGNLNFHIINKMQFLKLVSSMALLSLTKAQLDVFRAKQFDLKSLTALDRLLTLVDNGQDQIEVTLQCMRDPRPPATFPRYKTSDPRKYYFNNI